MNFPIYKAAEGNVAVAALTDNNVTDGNSDKSFVELWSSAPQSSLLHRS